MGTPGEKKKVYVGLSGGVDSSVSAALLKEAGYDVTGVFITVWQPDFIVCTASADRIDAMRVCQTLGIPFRDLDLTEVYKKEVVDYMIDEYKKGRTPNPDVMCNKAVKFGAFFEWAMKEGADMVATGHYARVLEKEGRVELHAGVDGTKDQSYFLWTLTEGQLSKTLFPVGDMEKTKVREEAARFNLPTATKKDSQGLCFIGKFDFKEFLSHFISTEPGNVLNGTGEIIGTHQGSLLYTLGERHGFTVTKKTPNDTPLYVVKKDLIANTITVSGKHPEEPTSFAMTTAHLAGVSWTTVPPQSGESLSARFRYRQSLLPVTVELLEEGKMHIIFATPIDFMPIGQSLVLYRGSQLVGGGIIEDTA